MSELQLNSLALKNFRCFEALSIDFHPQLTVLVAENGAGKTSVLDAIAVALGPFVGAFDDGIGPGFLPSDIRVRQVRDTSGNEMEHAPSGVSLVAKGRIPGDFLGADLQATEWQWKRHLAGPKKSKTTIKDAKVLVDCAKALQHDVREGKTVDLPLLAYYGTNRLWQVRKLVSKKLAQTSRMVGYTDCLKSGSNYKIFCEWFRYWSNSAFAHAHRAAKQGVPEDRSEFDDYIDCVVQAISTCLAPTGWCCIHYDVGLEELVALHQDAGTMPVAQLSDGVRNMIGLVADIAFRATKLNPHLGAEAARQTEGIVLIDEVDMHLHPSWQQTVLASLQEAFPKIQFVVTTHSPQVLSTVSREHIRVLEQRDGVYTASIPVFSPLAHESGDALARIMQVHKEPVLEIQQDIRAYEQLVRAGKEQSNDAKSLRAKIDQQGYQFHDSDLTVWRFLAQKSHGEGQHG
jgi:predicted ATP-binding protein involved in virulence